jgi:imidazole glycerol-phosphate synthase subunit HisH
MNVVIIDYGAGNLFSVQEAFKRLGVEPLVSNDPDQIRAATHVVFPGVGHAQTAMQQLKLTGLDQVIPTLTQPTLGICLGMQLMCTFSEEGMVQGLDIFKVNICKLSKLLVSSDTKNTQLPIPQMGWNDVRVDKQSEVFYFVHSYFAPLCADTWGIVEYIQPFSASLRRANFWGLQFHPEKSGSAGEQLLIEFLHQ